MSRVAIVGAGMAGLAAARALVEAGLSPVVFEKSRGVGGRAATRRIDGFTFDHGAQYVKAPSAALRALIDATGDAVTINRPIWTLTAANQIVPGDPAQDADPKWIWPTGITRLAKYLASGIDVRFETTVASLRIDPDGYRLVAADGQPLGVFAAIVLTAPAPQTAAIIAAGDLAAECNALTQALRAVRYRRSISVTVAFPRRPDVPWYALVNTDRQHAISWLACEHDKPGRAPADAGLLIAQMADPWAIQHWDALVKGTFSADTALPAPISEALTAIQALTGDLGQPLWINVQRWRYALPDTAVPINRYHTIFLAGDLLAGQGRVHHAIESGQRAAADVIAALS